MAMALVWASTTLAMSNGDTTSDHHEHAGMTDADPGDPNHHHGDSDDHHENGETDCHHHIMHCGCAWTFTATPQSAWGGIHLDSQTAPGQNLMAPAVQPSIDLIPHVPLA